MATKNTKTETTEPVKTVLKLPLVGSTILPAVTRLYAMKGGSLDFKLEIKAMKEQIDAKRYDALTDVRQAQAAMGEAKTKQEIADANSRLETQYKNAAEKTIEVVGKLPWSLFPDQNTVLSQHWFENVVNPENGQQTSLQGDYITEVANIYEHLIDLEG
ncbi:hypothetical protein [Runella limosa]|uniref:hypothetical protein n=1 Tax=Runella limosa TaxID=370978 RepID=UPI00041BCA64|nr:hypothetical protein [Runella limosa]